LIGDIIITCTGGSAISPGSVIPTANITVSLGTNVTSRLLGNLSEATLLIDEPQSGLPGIIPGSGPLAPQTGCTVGNVVAAQGASPGGCVQYSQNATTAGGVVPVMSSSPTSITPPANIYFGSVAANQVTFTGIPVLAPVTSGSARVYRITNIRANISGLGGGGLSGTTPLLASISISGSTSIPLNNPVQTAGFIQTGLSTALRNSSNTGNVGSGGVGFNQCNSANTSAAAVLQFNENFGTAFKTRVNPNIIIPSAAGGFIASTQATAPGAGQTPVLQNIPGFIYNSESGLVLPFTASGGSIFGGLPSAGVNEVGLADYGTRLKAVFNNIPTGVRIFVSVTNLAANTTNSTTVQPAGNSTSSFATLVTSEAAPEFSFLSPTAGANNITSNGVVTGTNTAIYEVPLTGQSGTAVWEVINTNPAVTESFNFGVWVTYSANPGNNSPPVGTGTVNLSFAPTPPVPFSTAQGTAASGSLTIPRFADTSTARNLLVINICQTLLLFPFVTNQNGFDTGLAIANTSTDPVGTGPQSGSCVITFYDGSGKPGPFNTGSVATATVYVNLLSNIASGFQGYLFALCNFQFAHGFAFISDAGARNLAMGYLALVVNNGTLSRGPSGETLGN
jgi:hypothetical protein